MAKYFLETTALVKRYKIESGSETVNYLFDNEPQNLFYLNLSIIEVRKTFYRLWRYPLRQEDSITETEFGSMEARFAADILTIQRVEFTEEMVGQATKILKRVWVKNVFDLAQVSAYLIIREEYPGLKFVSSDIRLIEVARTFVRDVDIVTPGLRQGWLFQGQ